MFQVNRTYHLEFETQKLLLIQQSKSLSFVIFVIITLDYMAVNLAYFLYMAALYKISKIIFFLSRICELNSQHSLLKG